jgi:hypothetical protein
MLFAPPPGYNTPATNRQNVQAYNLPGQQGLVPQGYNASAQPPAVPGMAPGGMSQPPMPGMQQPQGFNPNQMQMANALAGTAPRAAA